MGLNESSGTTGIDRLVIVLLVCGLVIALALGEWSPPLAAVDEHHPPSTRLPPLGRRKYISYEILMTLDHLPFHHSSDLGEIALVCCFKEAVQWTCVPAEEVRDEEWLDQKIERSCKAITPTDLKRAEISVSS